ILSSSSRAAGFCSASSPPRLTAYSSPSQRPKSTSRQRGLQKGKSGHSLVEAPIIQRSQIGHRTLIIGNSGVGLGCFLLLTATFRVCLGSCAAGSGFIAGGFVGRLAGFLFRLGRRLVRLAPVIGLVKAGPLEEY